MIPQLDGYVWLLLMLGPLIFFQRLLHTELQKVFLLLTRRAEIAIALFSILFLPGVVLHEFSHYIMAVTLRVKTGRFSLIPQNLGNGRLRLGYIETAKTDFFRDALIGFAPLLTGGLFVGYAGLVRLGMLSLWDNLGLWDPTKIMLSIQEILSKPDFWLWFYLTVVVSSTMMPSPSDRRAWVPLGIGIGLLLGLGMLVGLGPWMVEQAGNRFNDILRTTAIVLGISSGVHLVVLLPVWAIRLLISRLTGLRVTAIG